MHISVTTFRFSLLTLAVCSSGLVFFIYWPGLSGPFVFDDHSNLLINSYIKLTELSPKSLYYAAFSLESGPLQRPIPMASFALNYYFGQGFNNSFAFKMTNVIIHITNGLLVFWLMHLILQRVTALPGNSLFQTLDLQKRILLAAACAVLWLVHPIQLTSVLYVVQRMTELSALFTLLGMVFYMMGRQKLLIGQRSGIWWILLGLFGSGALGMYSKENAILLPLFILAMEFLLFANEEPWPSWKSLSLKTRRGIYVAILLILTGAFFWAFQYALNGYSTRNFTLFERAITEPRILVFYISLIVIPRLNQFSLYHDDIPISTSLLSPWTTVPSILLLAGCILLAFYYRKRHVLLSLGILWFFIGHMLESTIFNLEIVHEHRNYLPSLGIILILVYLVTIARRVLDNKYIWLCIPVLALLFSFNTFVRADQWSSLISLLHFDAMHHPKSARLAHDYGAVLYSHGQYGKSVEMIRKAIIIDPHEPGYYVNMFISAKSGNIPLTTEELDTMERLIAEKPGSILLQHAFLKIHDCLKNRCRKLQKPFEKWLKSANPKKNQAYFNYLLGSTLAAQGKYNESIEYLNLSYKQDPLYLHPLFELAQIYIHQGNVKKAREVHTEMIKANKITPHPRDREIRYFSAHINALDRSIKDWKKKKRAKK